ncbi:hypothetical protein BC834DRAFT_879123 [Gloeopeniophorella convolvens]|nr:hypothetical protein BC834DRAFT_879123 [Gloeopeniophorella convolvens]
MSAKCYLLDLPNEVLLSIAVKLSLADLLSCIRICRHLSALITESSILQYLIRTMRHGLHDPLTSEMTIPERVNALDNWEKSWLDLAIGENPQHYPLSEAGIYDPKRCIVQGGFIIATQFNKINLLTRGYSYIDLTRLPNKAGDVTCVNVPIVSGDVHVQAWTHAAESDLMAVILEFDRREQGALRLQLHQFSTGKLHPHASKPHVGFERFLSMRAASVDCCGDIMVVVILDGLEVGEKCEDFIFLVNWKTGLLTQLRSMPPKTYGALVTFLSNDIVAFTQRDPFSLEICELIGARDGTSPNLYTLCILRLPSPLSGQEIADVRLCQPTPLPSNHLQRRSSSRFPFYSNPEDDVIAFDVDFLDDHGRRIIFIARRRTLLSLAKATTKSNMPVIRRWETWGPRATHWMELDPWHDSISLAGSRCVLSKYSHLRSHHVLDLRDFNPYHVRTGERNNASQAILSAEACFEEDVVSELPYVSIRKENVGSRVLLDDEWMAQFRWDPEVRAQYIDFHAIAPSVTPSAQ